jgi:hypothetical protein
MAQFSGRLGDAARANDLHVIYQQKFLAQGRVMLTSVPEPVRMQYGLPSE